MSASELPNYPSGTYSWTTQSTKLRLTNADTSTVTVNGLADPSSARDAETITVTRTAPNCSPVTKTVKVTVAKVTFSKSANQRYGYDDFDTPNNLLDDHISIKSSDYTFVHVDIVGGATSADFNFACDNASLCTPVAPAADASFDLRLNAGGFDKSESPLRALVKCPSAECFAQIQVHVYKEKLVEVVVAKIYDSTVAQTNLNYATADYASHTAAVNDKMKEAVVRYDITNFAAQNGMTNVRYDLDNNGVLSFDIAAGGGVELNALKTAITGTGTKIRIAIVKDMKSFYYLSAPAAQGATTITVTAGSVFTYPGGTTPLGTGATQENVTVASSSGSTITLAAPLANAHPAGAPLEFPAGGWSCDPIVIIEGHASLDVIKWTIAHEAGHRALALADIVDTADIMNYMQSWTDHRLRYCPRNKRYASGTENQWETIPR